MYILFFPQKRCCNSDFRTHPGLEFYSTISKIGPIFLEKINGFLKLYRIGSNPTENNGACASNPCGPNTNCWTSGKRFLCTCDHEHPHGNPYYGCSECVYDSQCNPG